MIFGERVVSARKTTVGLLSVPRQTVSDAIWGFKELGNDDRRAGSRRKRTVNIAKNRKAIEKRVQRNLRVSMRHIALDMGISDRLSLVYADKPQTLDHLEDNIRRVIADIRPQMLEKVIENWTSRLDYFRASRGRNHI
ncbi:uncharacterized protein TNCV_1963631 [Trichonephila clavipes]|nr:uncharacterized protein TNCV_1963631 [Trichonephila clavipes]